MDRLVLDRGGTYARLKAQFDGPQAKISLHLYDTKHPKDSKSKPIPFSDALSYIQARVILYDLQGRTDFTNELLDEAIHPLLVREQWTVSDDEWDVLQPVLRLASKFLTTPTCWSWYAHVATGVLTKDSPRRDYISPSRQPLTESQKCKVVKRIFLELVESTRFKIVQSKDLYGRPKSAYTSLEPNSPNMCVSLSVVYLEKLAKHKARNPSGLKQLVCNLYTATILLHEIAHCVNHEVHKNLFHEPRCTVQSPFAEQGCSWECATFGFPLALRSNSAYEAHNEPSTIWLQEIPMERLKMLRPKDFNDIPIVKSNIQRIAPNSWIPRWFLKSTWARIEQEGLDFMQDGMCEVQTWRNYPVSGWHTVAIQAPGASTLPVVCASDHNHDAPVFFRRTREDISVMSHEQTQEESRYADFIATILDEVRRLEKQ